MFPNKHQEIVPDNLKHSTKSTRYNDRILCRCGNEEDPGPRVTVVFHIKMMWNTSSTNVDVSSTKHSQEYIPGTYNSASNSRI